VFKRNRSKVCIGENLSVGLSIQNSLKKGDALLPLLFNFDLGSAIGEGLDLNGTHQHLVCADDISILLYENI
jgi:hypothetical protein